MSSVKSLVLRISAAPRSRTTLFYVSVVLLAMLVLQIVTHAFSANFKSPFAAGESDVWSGDFLPIFFQFKAILAGDFGPFTPIGSERLGFPFIAHWNDYPTNHSLFFAIVKLLGFISSDWAVVLNLYWILTFPLAALTAAFLFRQLKITGVLNISLSLLFAFAPYHFFRHGHIWLASYFLVPLQLYVILTLFRRRPLFFSRKGRVKKPVPSSIIKTRIGVIAIILLSGWAGVYYAAFFCIFAAFAAFASFARYASLRHGLVAALYILVTFLSVLADSIPFLKHQAVHGGNDLAKTRVPSDVETFGFKPIQLFLPIRGHRLPPADKLATKYFERSPLTNENHVSSLGIVGAGGFLLLLLFPLFRARNPNAALEKLSGLAYLGLLTGVIGGIGAVLGYSLFGSLRCYNRVSIFLTLISLLAVGIFLKKVFRNRSAMWGVALALCAIGIADQTSRTFRYDGDHPDMSAERKFYMALETEAKATAVYQLPAFTMPEWNSFGTLSYYDPFKGYLFTERTKWSYGNLNGRYENALIRNVSYQEPELMVQDLLRMKYSHVLVSGKGYQDQGRSINASLEKILGKSVLADNNTNLRLYSLANFPGKNIMPVRPLRHVAYSFVIFTRADIRSADSMGRNIKISGRWEMEIYNSSPAPRSVKLRSTCAGADVKGCGNQIWRTQAGTILPVSNRQGHIEVSFTAQPGKIRLTIELPNGSQGFVLQNFHLVEDSG